MPWNENAIPRVRTLADALSVTQADLEGPLLKALGSIHRAQEKRIFATEGTAGLGRWQPLSPAYLARKIRLLGRAGKILVLSGDMKDRFVSTARSEYIQRYRRPYIQFGAASEVAKAHFLGGARLPRRDMITKNARQLQELRVGIVEWYKKRVAQVVRAVRAT